MIIMALNQFSNKQAAMKKQELQNLLLQFEEERLREQANLDNITKAFEDPPETKPFQKMKLVGMYKTALNSIEIEKDLLKKALSMVNEIQTIRFSSVALHAAEKCKISTNKSNLMDMIAEFGQSLPLWIGEPEEDAPALCGSLPPSPDYIAKVGDLIAALVNTSPDKSEWILAEVIAHDSGRNEYTIYDIYDEDTKEGIEANKIIPLPLWRAHPTENPEAVFPVNSYVLALFPQTTCFYLAIVTKSPEKPNEPYTLKFEDSHAADGYSQPFDVFQRYVLPFKEIPEDSI